MIRFLRAAGIAVASLSLCMAIVPWVRDGGSVQDLAGLAWPVSNILVGLLLTVRRPRLLVGWLFAAIGFLVTSGGLAEHLTAISLGQGTPAPWWGVAAAWYGEVYWPSMIYTMLVFLPLLFPTGRAPTPLLRKVTAGIGVILVSFTVLAGLQERLDAQGGMWAPNPIGIAGLSDIEEGTLGIVFFVLSACFLLTAFVGLLVRFRRGRGVERQQVKWFTSACAALIVGFVVQGFVDGLTGTRIEALDLTLFALPPAAAAVAVLRYRLYAIDRIISRTVTYALVTALLAGVYLAAVTVLTAVTAPVAGNSPIAVAAATLVAAAVFRPALRRIQALVDRRFNRASYDAARTVEAFRTQMRDDVDLDRLSADLAATAGQALQPRSTFVWVRAPEAGA